jgi:HEAT repeat protein
MTTEADVAEMKESQDIDGLIQAIESPEWRIRLVAAEALGELEADQAINALLRARNDENSNVRWAAVWALGQIGGDRALEVLLDSLEGDEATRNASLAVLQQIQDDRAREALEEADLLKKEARIPIPLLLKYAVYAAVGLGISLLILSIILDWPGMVTLIGTGVPLVLALVLWLVGGNKG